MSLENIKEIENEVENEGNANDEVNKTSKNSFKEILRKHQVTIGLIITVLFFIVLLLIYGITKNNPVNKINVIKEQALQTVASINDIDNNWAKYEYGVIKELGKFKDMDNVNSDVVLKEELNKRNKFVVDANKRILKETDTAIKNLETCKPLKGEGRTSCEDDVIVNYMNDLDDIIGDYYKDLANHYNYGDY